MCRNTPPGAPWRGFTIRKQTIGSDFCREKGSLNVDFRAGIAFLPPEELAIIGSFSVGRRSVDCKPWRATHLSKAKSLTD